MKAPLFLNRQTQNADTPVFVSSDITSTLNGYDIDSIRHIYKFFIKKTNVVINTDDGMKETKFIHAFITTIKPVPVLIICPDSEIEIWESQFDNTHNFNLIKIDKTSMELSQQHNMIVLLPHSILRRSVFLRDITWQFLVIQDIDAVINLPSINKFKDKFRVAITKHNFVLKSNQELFDKIFKWASNEELKGYNEFYEPNQWLRLSWHQYGTLQSISQT